MRRYAVVLLGLLVMSVLGACGPMAATPTATATPPPRPLIVYTALEEDAITVYTQVLERTHPDLELELVRASTGEITERLLNEKDAQGNPRADVVWGTAATSLLLAEERGMLEAYAPAGLERVDPRFRDPSTPPTWVGIDLWESAFCVNTELLAAKNVPVPTSWADLTKPIYKDMIIMPDPSRSGTGYLNTSGWVQVMGEEAAWEYMDALHENVVEYVGSGSGPCRRAAAGEIPIGVSFGYRAVLQQQEEPAIQAVWPAEGSGWDVEANALIKKPEIHPQARTFLDWAISDPIVREYAKYYPLTTIRTGLPLPEGYISEPLNQLVQNDLTFAAVNRERILDEWKQRYSEKSVD